MQTATTPQAQSTMQPDMQTSAATNSATTSSNAGKEILNIENVCRGFDKTQGEVLVLDGVNLTLHEGEIVGLLYALAEARLS